MGQRNFQWYLNGVEDGAHAILSQPKGISHGKAKDQQHPQDKDKAIDIPARRPARIDRQQVEDTGDQRHRGEKAPILTSVLRSGKTSRPARVARPAITAIAVGRPRFNIFIGYPTSPNRRSAAAIRIPAATSQRSTSWVRRLASCSGDSSR